MVFSPGFPGSSRTPFSDASDMPLRPRGGGTARVHLLRAAPARCNACAPAATSLADPQKHPEVVRWCFATLTTVEPLISMIVLDDFQKKTDPVSRERRTNLVKFAEQALGGVEQHLGEHAFTAGEEFTVAGILMVTVLRQARRAGVLAKFPRCEACRQKCEARPAWRCTVAAYEKRLGAEPGSVARVVEPTA